MSLTGSRAALLTTLSEAVELKRLEISSRTARWLMAGLCLASLLIQGGLFQPKTWFWTGDMIYHHALMAEIQAGELLPGGPYPGMPAFYSPLLHWMTAAVGLLTGLQLTDATRVISILFAPLFPLACYWTARNLGFDRTSAFVGALLSSFAGGWKLGEDRVWVDSLFVGQHNFFPTYPRDIAFLLLPLGLVCVYRSIVHGWRPGAPLAGVIFALMVLAHTQTAVFAAPLLGLYLLMVVILRPDLIRRTLSVSVVTAGLTAGLSSFWWLWELQAVLASHYFSVEMPASRVPVKLPFTEFPLEFGLFLLLGPLGIFMIARRFKRDRDLGALLLLVWWAAPVILAIARPTGFPGGDTFFPRRLWQFGSQPLVLMASLALVQGVLGAVHLGTVARVSLVAAVCAVSTIPASYGTWQRIDEFWNRPEFVDRDWSLTGNFAVGPWLAGEARSHGPRTVLAPTTEATLVWYEAGQKVVYLHRTAAIKLAFDVQRLSGFSESERQQDLGLAYSGSLSELTRIASKYSAPYVMLQKSDGKLALTDLAARAFQPRESARGGRLTTTNHYEFLAMAAGDRAVAQIWSPSDREVELRVRVKRRGRSSGSLGTLMVNGQEMAIAESELSRDDWADVTRRVPLKAGANEIGLNASAQLEVLRLTAFSLGTDELPAGWQVQYSDDYYNVLSPSS